MDLSDSTILVVETLHGKQVVDKCWCDTISRMKILGDIETWEKGLGRWIF